MKTSTWTWLAGGAGLLLGGLLLAAPWALARLFPSPLHRELCALREQVYYAPSQTYGQLDPYTERSLLDQSARLRNTLNERGDNVPSRVSTRIVIANTSVAEWLLRPGSEALRQQAVRDLDRAIAVTP